MGRPSRRSDFGINTGNPDDGRPKRFLSRQAVLHLVAENPFARKAMNALLNSLIGWGIKGSPKAPAKVKEALNAWIKVCDYYGRHDLYGLQELWARSMFRDGEVFIVRRLVAVASGIPLRLQSFDKGQLAVGKSGENIERGIEYDVEGRPIAYHFLRGRPETRWASQETVRFNADDVIHLFHSEYIGQSEGISIFESVVKRLGDVDEGIEAEVVKANISACMVGFRYRPPSDFGDDHNLGVPTGDTGPGGTPVEEMVPGLITTLEDGEQITFSNPPRTGGIADLARLALLASSAGVGVTYEQMTGDLSNVNFSSYRAGALEFKRTIGRIQFLTFIPIVLDRIWGWFQRTGIEFGHFANRTYPIEWTPPPFESIDRRGDAEADILEMQAGLESRENLLASRGYDHDDILAQIAAGLEKQKKAGLAFKGDPYNPGQIGAGDARSEGLVDAVARALTRTRAQS